MSATRSAPSPRPSTPLRGRISGHEHLRHGPMSTPAERPPRISQLHKPEMLASRPRSGLLAQSLNRLDGPIAALGYFLRGRAFGQLGTNVSIDHVLPMVVKL